MTRDRDLVPALRVCRKAPTTPCIAAAEMISTSEVNPTQGPGREKGLPELPEVASAMASAGLQRGSRWTQHVPADSIGE
jgi:hypothetical protein